MMRFEAKKLIFKPKLPLIEFLEFKYFLQKA